MKRVAHRISSAFASVKTVMRRLANAVTWVTTATAAGVAIAALFACDETAAQAMFRGDAAHAGVYFTEGPRVFRRVKWTFPTGDRIVSSPVHAEGVIYFGGDDGYVYAVDAADGRQRWKYKTGGPVPSTPAVAGGIVYAASYDGKLHAIDAKTGQARWKFETGGERRFEAKNLHGMLPKNQTIADAFDVFLSSPVVAGGAVYFGSGDGNVYAIDAATGREKWHFDAAGSWVISSPAVAQGKVIFGTSDSSLYMVLDAETGTELVRQQGDAFVFSSPSVAGNTVYIGVLNGTLEARDLASGTLLWQFETEASKRNAGWVLTADRRFNTPLLFPSNWRETPIVGTTKQFSVGSIFSSPLVVGSTAYFGSTDGNLYAVE